MAKPERTKIVNRIFSQLSEEEKEEMFHETMTVKQTIREYVKSCEKVRLIPNIEQFKLAHL